MKRTPIAITVSLVLVAGAALAPVRTSAQQFRGMGGGHPMGGGNRIGSAPFAPRPFGSRPFSPKGFPHHRFFRGFAPFGAIWPPVVVFPPSFFYGGGYGSGAYDPPTYWDPPAASSPPVSRTISLAP